MSCDFLVMSEAGVKLYHHRLAETLWKLKHRRLVLAISCWQVLSPANLVV